MSRLIDEVLAAVPPPRAEEPSKPARASRPKRRLEPSQPGRASRARRKEAAPKQKCTFALSRPLMTELRLLCDQEGVSQREVVERLLSAHVARRRHRLRSGRS